MLRPKKNKRNLMTKKVPAAQKFPTPPPPHNFSNGPSLTLVTWSILNHSLFCDGIQKAVLFCNLFRR